MAEDDENKKGGICCLMLFNLALGIAEAIILSKNTDARNGCSDNIWWSIFTICLIHHFILTMLMPFGYAICETPYKLVTPIIYTALSLWPVIEFFTMTSACEGLYKNQYRQLYNVLLTEVILAFINYACFLCIYLACAAAIGEHVSERREQQNIIDGFSRTRIAALQVQQPRPEPARNPPPFHDNRPASHVIQVNDPPPPYNGPVDVPNKS